jgi:flagellar hook assembly protein FlgD
MMNEATSTTTVVSTVHMNVSSALDDDEKLAKVQGIKPSVVVTVNSSGGRGNLTWDGTTNTDLGNGNSTRMLVSADGTEIYANAVGDPSKQAIVFIHGFVWSFMAFDDIFGDLEWTSRFYLVSFEFFF